MNNLKVLLIVSYVEPLYLTLLEIGIVPTAFADSTVFFHVGYTVDSIRVGTIFLFMLLGLKGDIYQTKALRSA